MGISNKHSSSALTPVNMTDAFTGMKKLKDLFRLDKVLHDNFLFKLHHQANFAIVLFGVAFIFGMNYLNGNSIECKGGGDFEKQYCWLHGAAHIDSTHYYLWVPFVLVLCLRPGLRLPSGWD